VTKAAIALLFISLLLAACRPVDPEIEAVVIDPAEAVLFRLTPVLCGAGMNQ
jgi:hypothetical protein